MTGILNQADLSGAIDKVDAAAEKGQLTSDSAKNVKRWLTEPQYGEYAGRIAELVDAGEFPELDRLFWEVIPFGTGGRRGTMADFGSATINVRTIAESAHGLATYVKKAKGTNDGRVVIARDTRNRSDEFSRLTATTCAAHGLTVFFFESYRATPELSFAVRHLSCDAGVMISASHNPPSDNGFKAYWSSGAQVLPPHDQGIIDCVYEAGEIRTADFDACVQHGRIEIIGDDVDAAYLEAVKAMSLSPARDITAVFTPLHGVGETSVYRVLKDSGFDKLAIHEPHRTPDGNFPNVPDHLPNPERPQVFEPVFDQANDLGAELILASDPDADRIGAVVRNADGEYAYLTGNRIGALVCDYILRKRTAAGTLSPDHYVVETMVTTPLIGAMARDHKVGVIDDLLVGFKYIGQTMDEEGPERFVFGAEESLGYLAGEYARDKDAAIGALYLLESAAELKAEGKTLWDRLDELFLQHGYHTEGQTSEYCEGPSGRQQIEQLMQAFREAPPASFGGLPLVRVRDYGRHEVRSLPDNVRVEDLPKPQGNVLFFESAPGGLEYQVAVRPSGTEPKIKFYYFVQHPCDDTDQLEDVKKQGEKFLSNLKEELSAWMKQQLDSP